MTISEILQDHGLTIKQLSDRFGIPYRTVQSWVSDKSDHRECPEYVKNMIVKIIRYEATSE